MAGVSKLITTEVVELAKKSLKTIGSVSLVTRKLEAVIAAKEHGIKKVSEVYGISRNTLRSWIKHVKDGKINKLYAPPERRKKNKLNDTHRKTIKKWLDKNSQLTIKEVRLRIAKDFGINISKTTVHREIQNLNYSYITPRPKHFNVSILVG